jgi:hypothetical protein
LHSPLQTIIGDRGLIPYIRLKIIRVEAAATR